MTIKISIVAWRVLAVSLATSAPLAACAGKESIELTVLDEDGPGHPWAKAVGDINGDGYPDIVIGGHGARPPSLWRRLLGRVGISDTGWTENGRLVWYESPGGDLHVISDQFRVRTDAEVADLDGDGRADVIAVTDQGIVWFRNPDWRPTVIDTPVLHDLEVADLDHDGDLDIVARNQTLFDHNNGDRIYVYRQDSPEKWTRLGSGAMQPKAAAQTPQDWIVAAPGEGLKLADIDGDQFVDIVVNQRWYRNPGALQSLSDWRGTSYCTGWNWPHAYLDVSDINGDGRPDIAMAPAEPVGERYRVSWCESPAVDGADWVEHVVAPDVETVVHSIVAGDFDNDGSIDLVTAAMHQGKGQPEVILYTHGAEKDRWQRKVIGRTGAHSMKALDFDQDGDLDLVGANWTGDHQSIELWINRTDRRTADGWRRHVIDASKPWRSVFVTAGDIDGDGRIDIASGGWWYRNSGQLGGNWVRNTFGKPFNNIVVLADLDGDGDLDGLASTWNTPRKWTIHERLLRKLGLRDYETPGALAWARNDGAGRFDVQDDLPSGGGDFPQGAAVLATKPGAMVALSWHQAGHGVQLLEATPAGGGLRWQRRTISAESQDEALTANDLDRDGATDLVLGSRWLRNAGNGVWSPKVLHEPPGKPDRNRVVDLDGDGRQDVVIGYEAISIPGKLAWYRAGEDVTMPWFENIIATPIGPMSVDAADIDGDGDIDIVVGEHNLARPESAALVWFDNRDGRGRRWSRHLVHVGDEHHDGALLVDLDGDGDLDIVSIGWGHDRLLIYENLRLPKPEPIREKLQ